MRHVREQSFSTARAAYDEAGLDGGSTVNRGALHAQPRESRSQLVQESCNNFPAIGVTPIWSDEKGMKPSTTSLIVKAPPGRRETEKHDYPTRWSAFYIGGGGETT